MALPLGFGRLTLILSTDVTRDDSQDDISGAVKIWAGKVELAAILVDHDPLRLQFYGERWRRGDPPQPTVTPDAFLDWLDSGATGDFTLDDRLVARGHRGRVRLAGGANPRLRSLCEAFRDAIASATRWREDSWIGAAAP